MDNQYETLSQATTALNDRGYTLDFNLCPDKIECKQEKLSYNPSEFHIDEFHRFEGMTDPGDMSVIYAITASDNKKGVLIDAYGTYSDPLTADMLTKMKIH